MYISKADRDAPDRQKALKSVKRERARENFTPCCSLKLSKEVWEHWALTANLEMQL